MADLRKRVSQNEKEKDRTVSALNKELKEVIKWIEVYFGKNFGDFVPAPLTETPDEFLREFSLIDKLKEALLCSFKLYNGEMKDMTAAVKNKGAEVKQYAVRSVKDRELISELKELLAIKTEKVVFIIL